METIIVDQEAAEGLLTYEWEGLRLEVRHAGLATFAHWVGVQSGDLIEVEMGEA